MTQMTRDSGGVRSVLVRYRLVVYAVGLLVIAAPLALSRIGMTVSQEIRTVLVLASLFVMVFTYVAERQFLRRADTHEHEHEQRREYSRQTRTAIGFALIGIAIGGYVGWEVNRMAGALFVVGALLFVRMAYSDSGEKAKKTEKEKNGDGDETR